MLNSVYRFGAFVVAGLIITVALPAVAHAQTTNFASAQPPPQMEQYAFKIGKWKLTARSMRPDLSFNEGTGELDVYLIHDGFTIQADMKVQFEDGTGFNGSTFRSYNPAEGNWVVTWMTPGTPVTSNGTGAATGSQRIETFSGSDPRGSFTDSLIFSEVSEDYFEVRMNRVYDTPDGNGRKVDGVWQYEATRVK